VVKRVRWDDKKATANRLKHGVRFEEAETVFHDPLLASQEDEEHSHGEQRFIAIGESRWESRLLVIIYTIRDDEAWLISARSATTTEKRRYMRGDRIREKPEEPDEMRPEYDFTNAVRGRHYIPMTITRVSIEDDVARYFSTDQLVNDGLRILIAEGRVPEPRVVL